MDPSPLPLILLIALSAMFSGSEIAFFSLSDAKIQALVDKKVQGALLVKKLKSKPDTLLITLLIGNNIVNISASAMATVMAIDYFGNYGAGIAIGVMTILILMFGEITPKSIAARRASKVALMVAPILQFIQWIAYPIIWIFVKINKLITHYFKSPSKKVSEEEIAALTQLGRAEGVIEKHEETFIKNILEFDRIMVGQIMQPRIDMIAINGDLTIKEVLDFIIQSEHSRYPVYTKDKDNITGMLHIQDIVKVFNKDLSQVKIKEIARKPLFVPNTNFIDDVFREMKTKRIHMAIVVDEHGGTDGIITMEDILEEIVGEIHDETDVKEILLTKKSHNTWIASGKIELKELSDHLNINFEDEYMTLHAFLTEKFEHLPEQGEIYETEEYTMKVISIPDKLIELVQIIKKEKREKD